MDRLIDMFALVFIVLLMPFCFLSHQVIINHNTAWFDLWLCFTLLTGMAAITMSGLIVASFFIRSQP